MFKPLTEMLISEDSNNETQTTESTTWNNIWIAEQLTTIPYKEQMKQKYFQHKIMQELTSKSNQPTLKALIHVLLLATVG